MGAIERVLKWTSAGCRARHQTAGVLFLAVFFASPTIGAQAKEPPGAPTASSAMGEPSGAVSEEALRDARGHFSNGVQLLQETPPNYQDAYYQFQSALEKSGGSWKVRGNLGYCALKLERDGEALEHYREYLARGADTLGVDERQDIERELLLIEGNLTRVVLSSSDPKAQIVVQRQSTAVPAQSYELKGSSTPLGLRSGSFTITATSGKHVLTWQPILTPGKEESHHFDFSEPPPAAAAPPEQEPPPAEPEPEAQTHHQPNTVRIVGYATAGVGVAALAGGLVTGLMSQSKEKQAKEDCVNLACPSAAESTKNAAVSLATTANILFVAGGVLTAVGVSLWLVGSESSSGAKSQASLRLSPGVQVGGGSVVALGTF